MTAATEGAGVTRITRRIALLPTAAGVGAGVVIAIGGRLAVTAENTTGATLVNAATVVVLAAMVSGFIPAHYAGLAALVIAALFEPGGPSTVSTATIAVTAVLAHELGRLSLDIRHETRFANSVLGGMGLRTMLVILAALALAGARELIADEALSGVLVPVSFALAAAPLFAHRLIADPPSEVVDARRRRRDPGTVMRAIVGVALAAVVLLAALTAAQARRESIESAPEREPPPAAEITSSGGSEPSQSVPEVPQSDINGLVVAAVMALAVIVAGLLWAAFRRPEQSFELDDLDLDDTRESIQITLPGRADLDEASVDTASADAMLDALLFDMRTEQDPGRAIRFGYATVERHLTRAGVEQHDHETVHEFLTRAVPTLTSGQQEMTVLTDLFEYARFGLDPVSEPMREAGIDAVETLRQALELDEASQDDTP